MKCSTCGDNLVEILTTAKAPYAYTLSGLENVFLTGIIVRKCEKCGVESPIIPRVGELHRLIANWLICKPVRLKGNELRFLRKNAGFPANKFAVLLGVEPAHLSRVENGATDSLGDPSDRLARVVAKAANGAVARQFLLDVADLLETKKKAKTKEARTVTAQVFTLQRNEWKKAA